MLGRLVDLALRQRLLAFLAAIAILAWGVDALVWAVVVVLVVRSRPEINDDRIDTSRLR